MSRRVHSQQGFRVCLGLVSLVKKHGEARVEAACLRALACGPSTPRAESASLTRNWTRRLC
ncbi:hypothetical protein DFAR_1830025 [Desulfarculales bacterium]